MKPGEGGREGGTKERKLEKNEEERGQGKEERERKKEGRTIYYDGNVEWLPGGIKESVYVVADEGKIWCSVLVVRNSHRVLLVKEKKKKESQK